MGVSMFLSKPFFRDYYSTPTVERISQVMKFEDTSLAPIVAQKIIQCRVGYHTNFKNHKITSTSWLYKVYQMFPKGLSFLSSKTHLVWSEVSYDDFGVNIQAERAENISYLGIKLNQIRESSEQ